jgi:hypothetical protein
LIEQAQEALAVSEIPNPPKRLDFTCSPSFIQNFSGRHGFALRRPAFRRRCKVTQAQMGAFIEQAQFEMRRYPPDRVANIDETHWKIVAGGFLTWAVRGFESVPCILENDAKEGVTVIAGITAGGEKLPLTVIGRGKTQKCLQGSHLPAEV